MKNDTETVEQQSHHVLYGKVIGVVRQQSMLDALVESLAKLGVHDIEAFSGASGIKKMETWKEAVSQYFFRDMEGKMVQRYLDAVADDLIVFAAVVEAAGAEKVAKIATSQGASNLVHFGNSVVTSY